MAVGAAGAVGREQPLGAVDEEGLLGAGAGADAEVDADAEHAAKRCAAALEEVPVGLHRGAERDHEGAELDGLVEDEIALLGVREGLCS